MNNLTINPENNTINYPTTNLDDITTPLVLNSTEKQIYPDFYKITITSLCLTTIASFAATMASVNIENPTAKLACMISSGTIAVMAATGVAALSLFSNNQENQ